MARFRLRQLRICMFIFLSFSFFAHYAKVRLVNTMRQANPSKRKNHIQLSGMGFSCAWKPPSRWYWMIAKVRAWFKLAPLKSPHSGARHWNVFTSLIVLKVTVTALYWAWDGLVLFRFVREIFFLKMGNERYIFAMSCYTNFGKQ